MKKSFLCFITVIICSLSLQFSAAAASNQVTSRSVEKTSEERAVPMEKNESLPVVKGKEEVSKGSKAAPATPYVKKISNTPAGVVLTWNKVNNAKGYVVYRAKPGDAYYKAVKTFYSNTSVSYTDSKAKSGQPYYYCVRAFSKSNGTRIYSDYKDYMNVYLSRPAKPSLSNGVTGVKISWSSVTGAGYYDIYRWTGNARTPIKIYSIQSDNSFCFDLRVKEGTTYTYGLVARLKYNGVIYSSYNTIPTSTITFRKSSGSGNDNGGSSTQDNKTVYRAFLVGEYTYNNPKNNLKGPYYDVNIMKSSLVNMNYKVAYSYNLSKSQIISQIKKAFSDADANDVSLFFYSGHGCTTGSNAGALYCSDGSRLTPAELAEVCKTIPGKVVIMLDSCGSGEGVTARGEDKASAKKFNQQVCEAFANADVISTGKSGEFRVSNKFFVLTGCAAGNYSYEASNSKYSFGYFTCGIVNGIGYSYDKPSAWSGSLPADKNRDSAITLQEAYEYCYQKVKSLSKSKQLVQIYPANSSQVIYKR